VTAQHDAVSKPTRCFLSLTLTRNSLSLSQSHVRFSTLSHSSTSLRFSLAPMHSRAHPRSLSHPSLTYASSSHPYIHRIAYFVSVLSYTRARNRTPPERRRVPPDSRNSCTYDWRDVSALGPRACKFALFPFFPNIPSHCRRQLSGNRLLLAI
jgi:hypothetical protein